MRRDEQDVVRLEKAEPRRCPSWTVDLWIDEDGVIYRVGSAAPPQG